MCICCFSHLADCFSHSLSEILLKTPLHSSTDGGDGGQLLIDECAPCRLVLKDVVKTDSISVAVDTTYEDFLEALQAKSSKQIADIKEPMR